MFVCTVALVFLSVCMDVCVSVCQCFALMFCSVFMDSCACVSKCLYGLFSVLVSQFRMQSSARVSQSLHAVFRSVSQCLSSLLHLCLLLFVWTFALVFLGVCMDCFSVFLSVCMHSCACVS